MRIVIQNGHVVDPVNGRDGMMDILVEDGLVKEVGVNLAVTGAGTEVIDATGKTVVPGLVDMHCHLRDPGFEYKETIETGTKSAAKGGITSVACMPNTKPVIDNKTVVEYINKTAKETGVVHVYPIGSVTKGQKGEELAEIGDMKFAGIVAISDDGVPVKDANVMRRAMQYASNFDIPVISHCEELSLVDGGVMNEGYVSTLLGLRGITRAAEEVMVQREAVLCETLNVPVHIAHVSTRGSVEIVRQAKRRGAPITCETCPHYFTLTEEAVIGYNTNAKMNPPLRTQDDVDAIIEGLVDGTIDAIATDHAPHHIDEKNVEFDLALNGIVGFETLLPLSVTYLVKAGHLTMAQLIEKLVVNPSNILGLSKNGITENKAADLTVFDAEETYTIDVSEFASKSKNSPYQGFEVSGKVYDTLVDGKIVVSEGQLV